MKSGHPPGQFLNLMVRTSKRIVEALELLDDPVNSNSSPTRGIWTNIVSA